MGSTLDTAMSSGISGAPLYRSDRLGILVSWQKGSPKGQGHPDLGYLDAKQAHRNMWDIWTSWASGEAPLLGRAFFEKDIGDPVYTDWPDYVMKTKSDIPSADEVAAWREEWALGHQFHKVGANVEHL